VSPCRFRRGGAGRSRRRCGPGRRALPTSRRSGRAARVLRGRRRSRWRVWRGGVTDPILRVLGTFATLGATTTGVCCRKWGTL